MGLPLRRNAWPSAALFMSNRVAQVVGCDRRESVPVGSYGYAIAPQPSELRFSSLGYLAARILSTWHQWHAG
jgi:hypothetical protein